MAVLMGAFLILGIQPGPAMLTTHLNVVWTLMWALIVGNLIAVSFLLFINRWVAMLTFVNATMLVPFILVLGGDRRLHQRRSMAESGCPAHHQHRRLRPAAL